MKRISLVCALLTLLVSSPIFSQNLDNNKVQYTYTRMPLAPLPEDLTQYWVDIDLGYIYRADSKTKVESQIKNVAKIDGVEKTIRDGARLLVRLETYYRGEREIVETTKSEKRGDEKVDVKYFAYAFEYNYPLYYELSLPGEPDPLSSGFLAQSDVNSRFTTRRYASRSELNSYWSENSSKVQTRLRQELLNKTTADLRAVLSSSYEFAQISNLVLFTTVKKFKKHSYEDVTASFEAAQKAMASISPEDAVFGDEFTANMQEAIDGWKKSLTESDVDDRKSRINKKVSEALYRNLYKGYTLMGDFENADAIRLEAEGRIKNAIPALLEDRMNDRRARFAANAVD